MKTAIVFIVAALIVVVSASYSPLGQIGTWDIVNQLGAFIFCTCILAAIVFGIKKLKLSFTRGLIAFTIFFSLEPWFFYKPSTAAVISDHGDVKVVMKSYILSTANFHSPTATIVAFDCVEVRHDSSRVGAILVPDSATILDVYNEFHTREAFEKFANEQFDVAVNDFFERNPMLTNRCCMRCILTKDSLKVPYLRTAGLFFF